MNLYEANHFLKMFPDRGYRILMG